MAVQLPSDVQGAAAGILTYSIFCLICALFLLWLIWVHNERTSYVAMLSFFVSLNCLASIIQQIHTIVAWKDVKMGQYNYLVANVGNPEIAIAGSSQGLDLALFYIQNYTYNVDALVVLFWALELTQSVYHLRTLKQLGPYASLSAKLTAVLLPVVQVGLLKSKAVQSSTPAFLFLTNFIIAISVSGGCILLFSILWKYIQTRRAFMSWNVQYAEKSGSNKGGANPRSHTSSGHGAHPPQQRSIYDRWLVIRFSIAFFALFIFEMFTIYFQVRSSNDNKPETIPPQPDLSSGKALGDFVLFIPGVSEGFLAFVVFGTTRTFRDYALRLLVPQRIWDRNQAKKAGRQAGGGSQAHIRTASSRDYLRFDTESAAGGGGGGGGGDGTPTTGRFQEGIDLREMDKAGGHHHARKSSQPPGDGDEWPSVDKEDEPPRTWYQG
ncbi:hypothetical protein GE09DRAFT_1051990 [Coniochaeta sp. 2T2.1]|nr:hypothetical protein GE09DRAFT_1051990 [Coniochaeta sp. 2T2.1]